MRETIFLGALVLTSGSPKNSFFSFPTTPRHVLFPLIRVPASPSCTIVTPFPNSLALQCAPCHHVGTPKLFATTLNPSPT